MRPDSRNRLGIALSILAAMACVKSCAGGEFHRLRKTQRITARPMRWDARAKAGYPFWSTTANTTRVVANISGLFNPMSWIFR